MRELLDRAVLEERKALARASTTTPGSPRCGSRSCRRRRRRPSPTSPTTTGAAARPRGLREDRDLLGRELLDQRFDGMKQLSKAPPRGRSPADPRHARGLNALLDSHARGEDTTEQFEQFMNRHGEFFPENPRNTDELLDSLAVGPPQLSGCGTRSPGSTRGAGCTGAAGIRRPVVDEQLDRLDSAPAGRPSRRGLERLGGVLRGDDGLGLGEGTSAGRGRGGSRAGCPATVATVSGRPARRHRHEALARQLGDEAVADARTLADLEKALQQQGFFDRAPDGQWRLSPKAMRQLGQTALRDVAEASRTAAGSGRPVAPVDGGADRGVAGMGVRGHRTVGRHPDPDQRDPARTRPMPVR